MSGAPLDAFGGHFWPTTAPTRWIVFHRPRNRARVLCDKLHLSRGERHRIKGMVVMTIPCILAGVRVMVTKTYSTPSHSTGVSPSAMSAFVNMRVGDRGAPGRARRLPGMTAVLKSRGFNILQQARSTALSSKPQFPSRVGCQFCQTTPAASTVTDRNSRPFLIRPSSTENPRTAPALRP